MSVEEELQENAEHGKQPFDRKVALTMAVITAVMAIVSVMGHILTTDELLDQQKASHQWAFYQAKAIRRYESDIPRDLLPSVWARPPGFNILAANPPPHREEGGENKQHAR